jgi:hypothetical protein
VVYVRARRKRANSLTSSPDGRDGMIENYGLDSEALYLSKLGWAEIIPTMAKKNSERDEMEPGRDRSQPSSSRLPHRQKKRLSRLTARNLVFVGSQFRLGSAPQFQTLAGDSYIRVIGQDADCQTRTPTVSSRRGQVGHSKNRTAGAVAPMDRAAFS